MQQWKEVESGRLWLTSVGNVLTVYVAKTSAGDFEARVVGMNGIIEIAADINFGRVAQDVGLAIAHRILRDEMLWLEGSAPTASDTHAELAALRDEVRRLREACELVLEEQTIGMYGAISNECIAQVRAALRGGD